MNDVLLTVVENGTVFRHVLPDTTIETVFLDYSVDFPRQSHLNWMDGDMLISDNMCGPCVLHWA